LSFGNIVALTKHYIRGLNCPPSILSHDIRINSNSETYNKVWYVHIHVGLRLHMRKSDVVRAVRATALLTLYYVTYKVIASG